MQIEPGRTISFRPTQWDAEVLESVSERNPDLTDVSALLRHLLRFWTNEHEKQSEVERLRSEMNARLERIEAILAEWYNEHTPGK